MDDETKKMMITRRYQEGHPILRLAQEFHLGQAKIRAVLSDAGVLRSRKDAIAASWRQGKRIVPESFRNRGKEIDRDEVIGLFAQEMNPSEIASRLNVGMRRIQSLLAEEGVILGIGRFRCESCEIIKDGPAQRRFCLECSRDGFGRRFTKFGVGKAKWERMLTQQGGTCALCERPPTFVDHDHSSGAVRGLLCNGCNTALGQIDRDIEWATRARTYKERSRA